MNRDFKFDKEGITSMIHSFCDATYAILDSCNWDKDSPTFELTMAGHSIKLPINADNINALAYTLLDMLISEETGEATTGNTSTTARTDIDKLFNEVMNGYTQRT